MRFPHCNKTPKNKLSETGNLPIIICSLRLNLKYTNVGGRTSDLTNDSQTLSFAPEGVQPAVNSVTRESLDVHSSSEAEVCLCYHQVARNTSTAVGCQPTHSVTLVTAYHLPLPMELVMDFVS